jgi:hypothetical protein
MNKLVPIARERAKARAKGVTKLAVTSVSDDVDPLLFDGEGAVFGFTSSGR